MPLKTGQVIRLEPQGPEWTVYRVTPCAAYCRRRVSRSFVAHGKDGELVQVQANSSETTAISINSAVYA